MFEHPQIRPPVGTLARGVKIRRGTLARMACETMLNRRCIAPPYPPWPGTSICAFSNTRFSSCFIAIPALNMRISRARAYGARTCIDRRGALNMHETRATATFALAMRHPMWKCLLFLVFYSMSCLRCAPDSSHSDISNQARHLDLLILKLCVFHLFYSYPLGNDYFS